MEHELPEPPEYFHKVHELNQAIFYCYNENAEKIPVSIINGFSFDDFETLHFVTHYFPVTEAAWNLYAGELYFYRKGIKGSFILSGVAIMRRQNGLIHVRFNIQNAEYFNMPDTAKDKGLLASLFKPYMKLYQKSSSMLLHTFAFKRKAGGNLAT